MVVNILIPVHNSGIYLFYTIEAILNNTKHPYKLILVESESTDGTDKICDMYSKKYPEHIEVYHTKKEGFVKAVNFGLSKCEGDVFLMQDDVIVPKLFERDWLGVMVKLSKEKVDCGLVTSLNGYGVSGPDYLNGLKWVGTWSMFIPEKTREVVPFFDEGFNPGMGDDIDFSYSVFKKGLAVYVVDFSIEHHRKTEHFQQNNELSKQHGEYFKRKWGLQ